MARRSGVVAMPRNWDSSEKQEGNRVRARYIPATGQRAKRTKKHAPSVDTDSSESLFHIDDAGAFRVALTEGDTFKSTGQYKRAIQSYSRALEKQPNHRGCLLARSHCYQQVGDSKRALADANKALQDDDKFIKGLLQKAECFYNMGEFEYALVNYHRGNKLRPEIQAFRLGVQKSQAAIENSIGDSVDTFLTKEGDLSFFADEQKPDSIKRREMELASSADDGRRDRGSRSQRNRAALGPGASRTGQAKDMDQHTVKQLLGQLYADKEYLEQLLNETESSSKSKTKETVLDLTVTCLDYLDTRAEFWSQQQPRRTRRNVDSSRNANDFDSWLIQEINTIKAAINKKQFKKAIVRSAKVLERLEPKPVDRYGEKLTEIHSLKGTAHLELNEKDLAIEHHTADLEISTKWNAEAAIDRAYDNLKQVYMKFNNYEEAADIFEAMLKRSSTQVEKAWLNHELGRCHFELKHFRRALEYGRASLEAAVDAGDFVWQLNASVLIAQSHNEYSEYQEALTSFNSALVVAQKLKDQVAEKAIGEAIKGLKELLQSSIDEVDATKEEQVKSDKNMEKNDGYRDRQQKLKDSRIDEKKDEKIAKTIVDNDELEPQVTKGVKDDDKDKLQSEATQNGSEGDNIKSLEISDTNDHDGSAEKSDSVQPSAADAKMRSTPATDRNDRAEEQNTTENEKRMENDNIKETTVELDVTKDISDESVRSRESEDQEQDKADAVKQNVVQASKEKQPTSPIDRYEISVAISDLEGAGTDQDIYVQLVGETGISRKEILERPSTFGSAYERGKTYTCTVSVLDVGKITKLIIGHSGSQPGSGCHISQVIVEAQGGGTPVRYNFECDSWLDRGQDDGLIERGFVPTSE